MSADVVLRVCCVTSTSALTTQVGGLVAVVQTIVVPVAFPALLDAAVVLAGELPWLALGRRHVGGVGCRGVGAETDGSIEAPHNKKSYCCQTLPCTLVHWPRTFTRDVIAVQDLIVGTRARPAVRDGEAQTAAAAIIMTTFIGA